MTARAPRFIDINGNRFLWRDLVEDCLQAPDARRQREWGRRTICSKLHAKRDLAQRVTTS